MKGNIVMNHEQIIRAWKDSSYRSSLSAEELAQMPGNPAGEILSEVELNSVVGGDLTINVAAYNTGGVCNTTTVKPSGAIFSNISLSGSSSFNFAPDCSTNSYTDSFNSFSF